MLHVLPDLLAIVVQMDISLMELELASNVITLILIVLLVLQEQFVLGVVEDISWLVLLLALHVSLGAVLVVQPLTVQGAKMVTMLELELVNLALRDAKNVGKKILAKNVLKKVMFTTLIRKCVPKNLKYLL